ncbi:hypothetical protein ACFWXO_21945 [Kitasatospora sp. NPDC059088]|uniref:hypothetical protein n=1 Tax=Kitasatospora sp. NPDC059088 TaxID=3346722 RepID=UPI0036C099B6
MTGRVPDPAGRCVDATAARLVAAAFAAIRDVYVPERHQIAAAVLTGDDRVHLGVHLDAMVGRAAACAESGALSAARLATSAPPVAIAAVRYPKPTEPALARIVPPCGLCRELLIDHGGPDLQVVVDADGQGRLVAASGLLVHKYVGTKWTRTTP